jgi:hypothetical protein
VQRGKHGTEEGTCFGRTWQARPSVCSQMAAAVHGTVQCALAQCTFLQAQRLRVASRAMICCSAGRFCAAMTAGRPTSYSTAAHIAARSAAKADMLAKHDAWSPPGAPGRMGTALSGPGPGKSGARL